MTGLYPRRNHRWLPSDADGVATCALCHLARRLDKHPQHGQPRIYSFRSPGEEWSTRIGTPSCEQGFPVAAT